MNVKKVLKFIFAGVIFTGVIGSTAISAISLYTLKQVLAKQEASELPEETREDGVKIAERYIIESTLMISDAYKSGDTTNLTDKQKETLDMAKAVLADIIKDDMTNYEKELAIYEWMTTSLQNDGGLLTVIPSTTEDCDKPYGVLKYHNAVCVGYATTFRMFMQMLDIDCKVVHGTEKYHTWDLINLDGDWYHVDIYSDAGFSNYANFNLTDQMMERRQQWDRQYFPSAKGIKYNFAYQNMKIIKDIYKIPKELRNALKEKKGMLCLSFEKEVKEEDAQLVVQMLNYVDQILMQLGGQDLPYGLNSYIWMQNEQTGTPMLWISINNFNTTTSAIEIDEKEKKKMKKALDKAFGDLGGQTGINFDLFPKYDGKNKSECK